MGRKRSRSRSDSRSRRRRRSSSSDSGSHRPSRSSGHKSKKKKRAQSRSRDRHSRSRSRSRERERGRSRRSTSCERRRRRSRSRERRHWSRSRDRNSERSRSRSRSRERRNRKKPRSSRSRSRSDSRSRRRRRSRSLSYDSRDSDRRKKPSSHDQSPSRGGSSAEEKPSSQSATSNLSSEIPGYMNMTPAERVRAKLKMMLEKSADKMNKEQKTGEESVMSYAPPSAADIARIEGDAFEPASFVSHRTAKKEEVTSGVGGAKKRFNVTSVDPSEYEPQVVELSDQLIQDSTLPSEGDPPTNGGGGKIVTSPCPLRDGRDTGGDEDSNKDATSAMASKNSKWLSKLQKLRQQFTAPPTD